MNIWFWILVARDVALVVTLILLVLHIFINMIGGHGIRFLNLVLFFVHEVFTHHTFVVRRGCDYAACNCDKRTKVIDK